jgi:hypothetical protein
MGADTRKNFTTPVGRLVMGSLYKPGTTDAEGKPLTIKNGTNAGQPRVNYFLALAIQKGQEQHWAQTPWGALIYQTGHTAFPQAALHHSFAWKIEDGDSTVPNKKGKKPCDQEGYKGHWILKFGGGSAPSVWKSENGDLVQILESNFVKTGYYIRIAGSVDGNNSTQNPGVYINHQKVLFAGYGEEIVFGISAEEAFGNAPVALPPGASAVPLASAFPASGMAPAPPAAPPVPSFVPAAPVMPAPATVIAPPVVPVVPNLGFLQVPLPPAPPVVPMVAPPPASGPKMTAKANGVSREAYIAGGWSDALLIAEGYMTL